jgi:hypothetical protein
VEFARTLLMSNLAKRLSGHQGAVILLCIMINVTLLVVHTILSNIYYGSNLIRMQMAAEVAVRAGAEYLPADPRTAMQVADAYAKLNGVMPYEIVSTEVASNDHALTIALKRELPIYITLFVRGLAGREINVTAQARRSQLPQTHLST